MDKKQIESEIKKKIDKWGAFSSLSSFTLFLLSVNFLIDANHPNIELIILTILITINFFGQIFFSTYVYDLIEKRFDDFIKREEYWKNTPLKNIILDFIIFIWIISPILAIISLLIIPLNILDKILTGLVFIIFWLSTPLFLHENKK